MNNMETIKGELVELSRPEQLKSLLSSSGPCISVYFPVTPTTLNPAEEERRWKVLVRQLGGEAATIGTQAGELVLSLSDWDAVSGDRTEKHATLVLFRSPEFFCQTWLRVELPE